MTVHLIKLCVGINSVEELRAWSDFHHAELREQGKKPESFHVTRNIPRRRDELLQGGSLYWVIKGNVQCRQQILDIESTVDEQGRAACKIILKPEIVTTRWLPKRAFQGWRYLEVDDAPPDDQSAYMDDLPLSIRLELAQLGLL